MKKTTLKKNVSIVSLLGLILTTTLLFTACKDDKEEEQTDKQTPPKVNCVIISRAQLQAWVDSGWTKPGSPNSINEVVLQFFGTNGGASLQLIGYPASDPSNARNNGKITLAIDTTCRNKPFTGEVIFGNNIMSFGKLGIFNKDGGLNKFDFIRLSPEQKYPPYVNYKVEVVNREQGTGEDDETMPCPVHCPPPPPGEN